jgi:hypothetical protein
MCGPVKRRSQEWGWNDPKPAAPDTDIDIDEPLYINDETAAAAVYLLDDPKFFDRTNKWVNKRFKRTRNPDIIRQELATNFMNQLINGINKLPSPYKDLAAVSLEKINWESLVDPYIDPITGPQYMSEEEEFESLEKAIQMLPEEGDLPLLPESEYELLEEKPTSPKIRYEEQYPKYRPTHTW